VSKEGEGKEKKEGGVNPSLAKPGGIHITWGWRSRGRQSGEKMCGLLNWVKGVIGEGREEGGGDPNEQLPKKR